MTHGSDRSGQVLLRMRKRGGCNWWKSECACCLNYDVADEWVGVLVASSRWICCTGCCIYFVQTGSPVLLVSTRVSARGRATRREEEAASSCATGHWVLCYFNHSFNIRQPLFTGRNEVLAKVIFLHLSVILFTGGGAPDIALIFGRGGAPDFALIFFWGGFPPNLGGGILGGGFFLGGVFLLEGVFFWGGSSKLWGGIFGGGVWVLQIWGGFLQIFGGVFWGGLSTGIRSTFGRYASYWNAFFFGWSLCVKLWHHFGTFSLEWQ